jgi:hypothetical protein
MDVHGPQLVSYALAGASATILARQSFPIDGRPEATRGARWACAIATLLTFVWATWMLLTVPSEDGFLLLVLALPVQFVLLTRRFFRYHRRRISSSSWKRVLVGNLLVLATMLSALLAIGEAWFRFVRDETDSIGYTKVARRWHARHYRFNNVGYRDNVDYALGIAPPSRRISFLGDSFTAGHGVADVDARFANLLRKDNPGWEVHVLARDGQGTLELTTELSIATKNGYAVDEVVLVYCLNDVQDLLPGWKESLEAAARAAEHRAAVFDSSYLLDTVYHRLAIMRLPGVGDYFSFVAEAYRGDSWEEQKRRLRALASAVQAAGGRLSVVTWPFLHALGADYAHAEAHARLDNFWSSEGVPHLDLLPVFRDHAPADLVVNSADAHPNEHAHALAAKAIGGWLLEVVAKQR